MSVYGKFARLARFIYKKTGNFKVISDGCLPSPCVYTVHHGNMYGPVHSLLTLPGQPHIWILSVFCDKSECYRQYADFTFTKRFHIPKALALPLAYLVSRAVPGTLKSFGAIPVYRAKREIVKTFEISLDALLKGESIVICPDINYSDGGDDIGEFYSGFLNLEKKYFAKTNRHLAFVPVATDRQGKAFYLKKPLYFDDSPFISQKEDMLLKIRQSMQIK